MPVAVDSVPQCPRQIFNPQPDMELLHRYLFPFFLQIFLLLLMKYHQENMNPQPDIAVLHRYFSLTIFALVSISSYEVSFTNLQTIANFVQIYIPLKYPQDVSRYV